MTAECNSKSQIGSYVVNRKKKLGKGGQGCVMNAKHALNKRSVAVKIYDLSKGTRGFVRETKIIAKMKEAGIPNIAEVYESVISGDEGFVMMKKYRKNLNQHTYGSEEFYYSEKSTRKLLLPIFIAIKEMHKNGIAHLDIKPSNILIDSNSNALLCDFGHAICGKTKSTVSGTRSYAAPEQNACNDNSEYATFPCDIYSLAVVLHFILLTCFPQFDENNQLIFGKVMGKNISSSCFDLLRSMLAFEPHKRPTIDQVMAHPWFQVPKERSSIATLKSFLRGN